MIVAYSYWGSRSLQLYSVMRIDCTKLYSIPSLYRVPRQLCNRLHKFLTPYNRCSCQEMVSLYSCTLKAEPSLIPHRNNSLWYCFFLYPPCSEFIRLILRYLQPSLLPNLHFFSVLYFCCLFRHSMSLTVLSNSLSFVKFTFVLRSLSRRFLISAKYANLTRFNFSCIAVANVDGHALSWRENGQVLKANEWKLPMGGSWILWGYVPIVVWYWCLFCLTITRCLHPCFPPFLLLIEMRETLHQGCEIIRIEAPNDD